MDLPEETPPLPARHYGRKAAEARRTAEGVTTQTVRAQLHGLARNFERLADAADSAAQTPDALAAVIKRDQEKTLQPNRSRTGIKPNPRRKRRRQKWDSG